MTVKIIDTFPFDGDWILRMRLEFLFPHVDEFVITESWHTFSGDKKTFLYRDRWVDLLKPYWSKIHWIVVEDYPSMTEEWYVAHKDQSWFREKDRQSLYHEHYQRDAASSYIHEKYNGSDYIVNVGDVDEVPQVDIFHPDVRRTMHAKLVEVQQPLRLEMQYFYYNFFWKKPYHWYKSYILADDRLSENKSLSYWRDAHRPSLVLRQAGWHFRYFMEVADIQRRAQKDTTHIHECIAHGKDLFHDDEHLVHDEKVIFPDTIASFRGELDYLQLA